MSRKKMILLDILLLHMILLACIEFIMLIMKLSRLTIITLRTFTIGHCHEIYLHLLSSSSFGPASVTP